MKIASAASQLRLQQRVIDQEARVAQGLKSGALTPDEAAPFQQRLDAVKTQMADGFDAGEGRALKNALSGLSHELKASKHNEVIDPAKRVENIDQRIAKGVVDGSLTQAEADDLSAQSVAAKAALTQAVTPEARLAAVQQIEALSKQVHVDRHDGEMDAGQRVEGFAGRIAAGLTDGSLTQVEATRLAERLGGVSTLASNGVTDATMVNQLNREIFRARHNRVA